MWPFVWTILNSLQSQMLSAMFYVEIGRVENSKNRLMNFRHLFIIYYLLLGKTLRSFAWRNLNSLRFLRKKIFSFRQCWFAILLRIFCLLWVLSPTREFFNHMEMSPLPKKGFKFWLVISTHGHWAVSERSNRLHNRGGHVVDMVKIY